MTSFITRLAPTNCFPVKQENRGRYARTVRLFQNRAMAFPSPGGEGQGEGGPISDPFQNWVVPTPHLPPGKTASPLHGLGPFGIGKQYQGRQSGFTQEELLAVVGILVLLIGLLFVWIRKTRDRSKEWACMANEKPLVVALNQYALDHTNYPTAGRWDHPLPTDWLHWQADRRLTQSAIAGYLLELGAKRLVCPLDLETRYRLYPFSYTMNGLGEGLNPARMANPSEWILLFEENRPNDGACLPGNPQDVLARRHWGQSHAALADGRVKAVREAWALQAIHAQPLIRPTK